MSGLSPQELKDYQKEQAELAKVVQGATGTDSYSSGRGRG